MGWIYRWDMFFKRHDSLFNLTMVTYVIYFILSGHYINKRSVNGTWRYETTNSIFFRKLFRHWLKFMDSVNNRIVCMLNQVFTLCLFFYFFLLMIFCVLWATQVAKDEIYLLCIRKCSQLLSYFFDLHSEYFKVYLWTINWVCINKNFSKTIFLI